MSIAKFSKGHNFLKRVCGVTVLVLCTSSDHVLYLYQLSQKYLKGFNGIISRLILKKAYKFVKM